MLELSDVNNRIALRNADRFAEIADGLRSVSTPPQPAERGHARIVPAADDLFLDQSEKPSFAQDGITEIQARKFDLHRP